MFSYTSLSTQHGLYMPNMDSTDFCVLRSVDSLSLNFFANGELTSSRIINGICCSWIYSNPNPSIISFSLSFENTVTWDTGSRTMSHLLQGVNSSKQSNGVTITTTPPLFTTFGVAFKQDKGSGSRHSRFAKMTPSNVTNPFMSLAYSERGDASPILSYPLKYSRLKNNKQFLNDVTFNWNVGCQLP